MAVLFGPSAGTNRLRIDVAGVTTNGTADHAVGSYVFVLRYDRAASAAKASSDLETVTGTYSAAAADGNKGIGYGTTSPGSVTVLLVALWQGANAETLDDTKIATIRSRIESPP